MPTKAPAAANQRLTRGDPSAALDGPSTRGRAGHGAKMPCVRKTSFGNELGKPSAPPSKTFTLPSCQIVRLPSLIAPGTIESAVVVSEQSAPFVGDAVALHGGKIGK